MTTIKFPRLYFPRCSKCNGFTTDNCGTDTDHYSCYCIPEGLSVHEQARHFLSNRCCTFGLVEATQLHAGQPTMGFMCLFLARRCNSCSIQSDWHNGQFFCTSKCCPLDSDCLKTALALTREMHNFPKEFFDAMDSIVNGQKSMESGFEKLKL